MINSIAKTILFSGLGIVCFLSSCFEPAQGCLDFNATNFDVSADEPCSDNCCTFPTLNLCLKHIFIDANNTDTSFLVYNTDYPANDGDMTDSFSIERVRYVVSNFKLIKTDGDAIALDDSLTILVNGDSVRIEDNFTVIDRDRFTAINVGSFLDNGLIDSISFSIGLTDEVLQADTNSIAAGTSLDLFSDTLLFEPNTGFVPFYMAFNRDTLSTIDSTVVKIDDRIDIRLKLDSPYPLGVGFDVTVNVQANVAQWFKDIDLPEDGEPANVNFISPIIVENIVNSFTISSIE